MSKVIKIGILGLGVVGSELVNIISQNREQIEGKYNTIIEVKRAFVRDIKKARNKCIDPQILTQDPYEVLNDPEIDIICECVGGMGTQETREYVNYAINKGKHVVMSSKKVLAKFGEEILQAQETAKIQLRFDATVGGGIPVTKIIKESFKGEKIKKIVGILNATSNFIYTYMEKKNYTFEEALKLAQKMGYAENDPTEDISGFDALYKLVILTIFSMKKLIDIDKIKTSPFSDIDIIDMRYAEELGYRIKPLAVVEDRDGKLTFRVGPCLIEENHLVANTVSNYNIITIEGSNSGTLGFYGQGAGAKPTASAMFDDLISVLSVSGDYAIRISQELSHGIEKVDNYYDYTNNLYWRYTVENKIGVLAKICNVFVNNEINIEKLIQKDDIGGYIDVVLLTSSVDAITINKITTELNQSDMNIITIIPFFND